MSEGKRGWVGGEMDGKGGRGQDVARREGR